LKVRPELRKLRSFLNDCLFDSDIVIEFLCVELEPLFLMHFLCCLLLLLELFLHLEGVLRLSLFHTDVIIIFKGVIRLISIPAARALDVLAA